MGDVRGAVAPTREAILRDLVAIVSDIVQDWDLDFSGGISERTRLIDDLGFQSIDVVMLIGEVQKHYGRRDLPFERLLIRDGRYVDEITIATFADFLDGHVGRGGAGGARPADAATRGTG